MIVVATTTIRGCKFEWWKWVKESVDRGGIEIEIESIFGILRSSSTSHLKSNKVRKRTKRKWKRKKMKSAGFGAKSRKDKRRQSDRAKVVREWEIEWKKMTRTSPTKKRKKLKKTKNQRIRQRGDRAKSDGYRKMEQEQRRVRVFVLRKQTIGKWIDKPIESSGWKTTEAVVDLQMKSAAKRPAIASFAQHVI